HRRPEQREGGVEPERAAEPHPGCSLAAEAALDHAAVEEQKRVACAEPERVHEMSPRLAAPAGLEETPSKCVLRVDAWCRDVGIPGPRQRVFDVPVVVEVEERC